MYYILHVRCMYIFHINSQTVRHSHSFHAEPVPVSGPAQLPGSFGPVWDRLHRGLGL